MNFYIQQSININMLRVDGITNSSVLQIGSAGMIKPSSYLYNSGGFTGPAPEAVQNIENLDTIETPSVPLTPPV